MCVSSTGGLSRGLKHTLGGNANDLVLFRSKHWEIKLRRRATLEVLFPLSCWLLLACALVCVRTLNLVKSDFTCWNMREFTSNLGEPNKLCQSLFVHWAILFVCVCSCLSIVCLVSVCVCGGGFSLFVWPAPLSQPLIGIHSRLIIHTEVGGYSKLSTQAPTQIPLTANESFPCRICTSLYVHTQKKPLMHTHS